ncbi:MAG: hypothetical protein KF805_07275 [Phycisphaeraceae bacterium]|nr:hypothetical protein [Phycisphaeraceae bacterium]
MTSLNAPAERDINWGPERTSIVAILALVFALPCFIPGAGIVASLLAVFALVGIAGSKGRVGGTGLAIAALVLGLFGTALWTALGYGAWQAASFFDKQIVGSTAIVMNEIKDGEWDKVKNRFVPLSADNLSPETFETFRAAYREKFGEFVGAPSGLRDIIDDYSKLGPLMANLKNPPNNTIPVPLRFEKGPALLMMEFDPSPHAKPKNPTDTQGVMKALPIRNLTLLGQGGAVVVLIDPSLLPSNTIIQLKPGSPPKLKSVPAQGGEEPAEAPKQAEPVPPAPSPASAPKKPM